MGIARGKTVCLGYPALLEESLCMEIERSSMRTKGREAMF